MKKFICGLLIGLLLSLPLATFASGQALKIIVNEQDITDKATPVLINSRTYLPIRAITEALDIEIIYDEGEHSVFINSLK